MSLIVETGAGLADAESYASVADADAYFGARGNAAWSAATEGEREIALRVATDYMLQTYRSRWLGFRVNQVQGLDWPRYDVPQPDVVSGDGYGGRAFYPADAVPVEVKRACFELAGRVAAGVALLEDLDQAVASETVGPISTTYVQGSSRNKSFQAVDRQLTHLIHGRTGARLVRS